MLQAVRSVKPILQIKFSNKSILNRRIHFGFEALNWIDLNLKWIQWLKELELSSLQLEIYSKNRLSE